MKLKKFFFKSVNSTNDAAIRIIKNSNIKFGIIISDKQKKGKGQYGKKWISFKGNLFVSIFFSLKKINIPLKEMTKINCYLIKKLISRYSKNKITIKAPNDLLINKKKVCGILQETLNKTNTQYLIVGIGINLIKSPKIRNYQTTNMLEITNNKIDNKHLASKVKKIYEDFIPKLYKLDLKTINNI